MTWPIGRGDGLSSAPTTCAAQRRMHLTAATLRAVATRACTALGDEVELVRAALPAFDLEASSQAT